MLKLNIFARLGVFLFLKNYFYKNLMLFMQNLTFLIVFLTLTNSIWGQSTADSLHQVGNRLYGETKYEDAIQNWKASAAIRQRDSGEVNLNVAKSYRNISAVSGTNLENYQEGVNYALKSHSIRVQILGEIHRLVADSYLNLANSYVLRANLGDLQKAHSYYDKASTICIELGEPCKDLLGTIYFQHGNLYIVEQDHVKALEFFKKSLEMRLSISGEISDDVAESYTGLGVAHLNLMSLDSALFFLQKALQIRQQIFGEVNLDVAISHNNVGNVYFKRIDYQNALSSHQKALDIQIAVLGNAPNPYSAASYLNIGTDYDQQGDYYKALDYYFKALATKSSLVGEEHYELCDYLENIGQVYHAICDDEKALFYQNRAIAIRTRTFGENHLNLGTNYNSIGLIYESQKEFEKALNYLQRGLVIRKNNLGEMHPLVAEIYNNLGTLYTTMGKTDLSLQYFEKANKIRLEISQNDNPDIASTWFSMGMVFMNDKKWKKTDVYFEKALKAIRYEGQPSTVTSITHLIKFLNTYSICHVQQFKQTGELSHLNTALRYSQEAKSALKYQSQRIQTRGTEYWFASEAQKVYEQQILVENLLYKQNRNSENRQGAFSLSEQNKSRVLQSQIKSINALSFSGIDNILLKQEQDFRVAITWREKRKQELLINGIVETDSSVLALGNNIFDLRQQYDQLIHRLETEYPEYYKAKYDLRTETVKSIQRDLLQPGETLLEYFTGDSSIFIFVVQPDHYEVVEVPRDFPLEDCVKAMRSGITDWYLNERGADGYTALIQRYTQAAHNLYQKLIAPIDSLLPKGGRIIVIPDGVLTYVPFEALLSEAPKDIHETSLYKYWLLNHDISYCYSATLLREMRERKHLQEPTLPFLGMAPTYASNTTKIRSSYIEITSQMEHAPLIFNDIEVDSIQKMLGGQTYIGPDATEERFVKEAWKYRIAHPALHGEANDRFGDYSYLAFFETPYDSLENEWLYVREIYNLSLNADLVTLSACQTGLGELRRGEGIIGLTRAFTYAGAKSIVNSLWSVDDNRTMMLMVDFYRRLKNGERKDAALSAAKRAFVESKDVHAHPFFWAGFIGIGDMGRIGF